MRTVAAASAADQPIGPDFHRRDLGQNQHSVADQLGGERLKAKAPHRHWKRMTLIAGPCFERVDARG